MIWDISEEHKVCYKDKNILKNINVLTDIFDDVIKHIYDFYDRSEFFVDVFYTESANVGIGIYEQLMKYLKVFIGKRYRESFIDKYKNDSCECELISSGNLNELFQKAFDFQYGKRKLLDDEKAIEILNKLADEISNYIGYYDADFYKIRKIPLIFGEFYPLLLFDECCIQCGNYIFLIMFGTTD